MRRLLIMELLLMALLLTACAPFSKRVMSEVNPTIPFADVLKDPDRYKGQTVLWGGVIIETTNREGETLIKVRQTNLDLEKSPINTDKSAGRFIVRYHGFLDPAIFDKGREITVVGTLSGKEEQALGEARYLYPVVDSKELRLWEKRREVSPYDPWFWGPPYDFGYPYPYPWWHRHPYW